jgi:hypothetical protein
MFYDFFQAKSAVPRGRRDVIVGDVTSRLSAERFWGGEKPPHIHIQCSDCKEDYIGETERPLHKRLLEHQTRTQSAVYEHIEGSNHTLDLQSTSVWILN